MPIAAPPITAASAVATRLVTLPAGVAGTLARSSLIRTSQPNVRRRVSRADGTRVPTCPRRMFGTARDREMTPASCAQGGGSPTMRLPPPQSKPPQEVSHVQHTSARNRRNGSRLPRPDAGPGGQRRQRSRARRSRSGRPGPGGPRHPRRADIRGRPSVGGCSSSPRAPSTGSRSHPVAAGDRLLGIVDGRSPGEYLAMPDNGYSNKLNSFDFELRAYYITPDFKTAKVEPAASRSTTTSPSVTRTTRPASTIVHKDPAGRPPAHGRRLRSRVDPAWSQWRPLAGRRVRTVDPALQRRRRPARAADRHARRPDVTRQPAHDPTATVAGSRGLEAMAISPNGKTLTFILEGAVRRGCTRSAFSPDLPVRHRNR